MSSEARNQKKRQRYAELGPEQRSEINRKQRARYAARKNRNSIPGPPSTILNSSEATTINPPEPPSSYACSTGCFQVPTSLQGHTLATELHGVQATRVHCSGKNEDSRDTRDYRSG